MKLEFKHDNISPYQFRISLFVPCILLATLRSFLHFFLSFSCHFLFLSYFHAFIPPFLSLSISSFKPYSLYFSSHFMHFSPSSFTSIPVSLHYTYFSKCTTPFWLRMSTAQQYDGKKYKQRDHSLLRHCTDILPKDCRKITKSLSPFSSVARLVH